MKYHNNETHFEEKVVFRLLNHRGFGCTTGDSYLYHLLISVICITYSNDFGCSFKLKVPQKPTNTCIYIDKKRIIKHKHEQMHEQQDTKKLPGYHIVPLDQKFVATRSAVEDLIQVYSQALQ